MALWRITCRLEERYVVADAATEACEIAQKYWAQEKDPTPDQCGHECTGVALVSLNNPWPS